MNYNLYIDFSARFLVSWKKFKTLDNFKDARAEGYYKSFYLGVGLGYEF